MGAGGVVVIGGSATGAAIGTGIAAAAFPTSIDEDRFTLYRGGSATNSNLTPRPGKDTDGLTAWNSVFSATKPGGKAQVIDPSLFVNLQAVYTPQHGGVGHYSITSGNAATDAQWAATRGGEVPHPLTLELRAAIITEVRLPK